MEDTSQSYVEKHLKWNMIISVVDGSFFSLGIGMVPLATLTYFVSMYIHSSIIIGLLSAMSAFLVNVPQVFMARYVESKERNKPYVLIVGIFHRLSWILLGLAAFYVKNHLLLAFCVFLFYGMFSLAGGVINVGWFDIMAKVIPERVRGRYFGFRTAICSVLEFISSLLMGYILGKYAVPYNYGIIFLGAGIFTSISYLFFAQTKEPKIKRSAKKEPLGIYFKNLFTILKEDKNFSYFLIAMCLSVIGTSAAVFRIVYAKDAFNITGRDVSIFMAVWIFSRAASASFWGILNDKKGYKITMIISHLIFALNYFLINLMPGIWMFYVVIALYGIAEGALFTTQANYTISLGGEKKRATYLGLAAIVLTPVSAIGPLIIGWIIDAINYQTAFYFAGILMLLMVIIMYRKVQDS